MNSRCVCGRHEVPVDDDDPVGSGCGRLRSGLKCRPGGVRFLDFGRWRNSKTSGFRKIQLARSVFVYNMIEFVFVYNIWICFSFTIWSNSFLFRIISGRPRHQNHGVLRLVIEFVIIRFMRCFAFFVCLHHYYNACARERDGLRHRGSRCWSLSTFAHVLLSRAESEREICICTRPPAATAARRLSKLQERSVFRMSLLL